MRGKTTPRGAERRDHPSRNVQPKQHDPYAPRRKAGDVTACDRCGAVNRGGRWSWDPAPEGAETATCPACRRIADRHPGGRIRLCGVPRAEVDEIQGLIANAIEHETAEHPLERLMRIEDRGDELIVTTTGLHAARCVAAALKRRFHGGVSVRSGEEQGYVEVEWSNDPPKSKGRKS